jgi:hypothetical protein
MNSAAARSPPGDYDAGKARRHGRIPSVISQMSFDKRTKPRKHEKPKWFLFPGFAVSCLFGVCDI